MVKVRNIYCNKCHKYTAHVYVGKKLQSVLPLMHYKYWMCYKCGNLHIQDTAYPETSEN